MAGCARRSVGSLGSGRPAGAEIGWSRTDQVPKEEYDSLYQEFNPALFNAREWIQLIKDSGFQYITFVSKHHDGFVMSATKQTDHNIMNTPFHRDWLKEIADECRRQGIIFGTYYSILDWYQYDYSPYGHGGPGFLLDRKPDFNRYVDYMKAELKELIQGYGSEIILFDGEWDPTWNHDRGSDLYRYLRGLRDDIVISSRVDKGRYGEGTTGEPALVGARQVCGRLSGARTVHRRLRHVSVGILDHAG